MSYFFCFHVWISAVCLTGKLLKVLYYKIILNYSVKLELILLLLIKNVRLCACMWWAKTTKHGTNTPWIYFTLLTCMLLILGGGIHPIKIKLLISSLSRNVILQVHVYTIAPMPNFPKNNNTKRKQKTYIWELRHISCRSKSKVNFHGYNIESSNNWID